MAIRTDRWFKSACILGIVIPTVVSAVCVFVMPTLTGDEAFGAQKVATAISLLAALGCSVKGLRESISRRVLNLAGLSVAFAGVNVLTSVDHSTTAVTWGGLLGMTSLSALLMTGDDEARTRFVMHSYTGAFLLMVVIIAGFFSAELNTSSQRMQSLGLYSGGLFFVAWSVRSLYGRWILQSIGLMGVAASSSRWTAISLVIAWSVSIVAKDGFKSFIRFGVIGVVLLFAGGIVSESVQTFLQRKEGLSGSIENSLMHTFSDRVFLVQNGIDLVLSKPFGFGLGNKQVIDQGGGNLSTVHNGYLTSILEVGVLGGTVLIIVIGSSVLKILKGCVRKRAYYSRHVGFVTFILVRAMAENYLVFNIGNPVIQCFDMILVYFTAGLDVRGRSPEVGIPKVS